MAISHLCTPPLAVKSLPLFKVLRPSLATANPNPNVSVGYPASSKLRSFRGLAVSATSATAPKNTSVKPLGDRVLIKAKPTEVKITGGIFLPAIVETNSQAGEVVAVGPGKGTAERKVPVSVKVGSMVMYSKYSGTEVELDGSIHLLLKEEDIIGVLETDDVKDLKPLNDRVLVKVAEAEEKTTVGLYLTAAVKQKPTVGTVIALGTGHVDAEGKGQPLPVSTGDTVLFSKYSGSDLKGKDGSDYMALRVSEIMAVVS